MVRRCSVEVGGVHRWWWEACDVSSNRFSYRFFVRSLLNLPKKNDALKFVTDLSILLLLYFC